MAGRERRYQLRLVSPPSPCGDPSAPKCVPLSRSRGCVVFGRAPGKEGVVLSKTNPLISRVHATLCWSDASSGGRWVMLDGKQVKGGKQQRSTNGVYFNKVKRARKELADGDEVIFGGLNTDKDGDRWTSPDLFRYRFERDPGDGDAAKEEDSEKIRTLKRKLDAEKQKSSGEKKRRIDAEERQKKADEAERAARQKAEQAEREREQAEARVKQAEQQRLMMQRKELDIMLKQTELDELQRKLHMQEEAKAKELRQLQRKAKAELEKVKQDRVDFVANCTAEAAEILQEQVDTKIAEFRAESAGKDEQIRKAKEELERVRKDSEAAAEQLRIKSEAEAEKLKQRREERQKAWEEQKGKMACIVCCEYLLEPRSLGCGHTACHDCFLEHLRTHPSCLKCRAPADRDLECNFNLRDIIDSFIETKPEEPDPDHDEMVLAWKALKEKAKTEEAADLAQAKIAGVRSSVWRPWLATKKYDTSKDAVARMWKTKYPRVRRALAALIKLDEARIDGAKTSRLLDACVNVGVDVDAGLSKVKQRKQMKRALKHFLWFASKAKAS